MINDGWIKLHRKLVTNELYPVQENRKFSELEAWIDILLNTLFKNSPVKVNRIRVSGKKGQCVTTIRELERKWKWSTTKITNFLEYLTLEGQIKYKTDKKKTVITLLNWGLYQDEENSKETVKKQQNDSEKTVKKQLSNTLNREESKEGEESINLFHKLIQDGFEIQKDFIPAIEQWLDYKQDKKQTYKNEASLKAFCKKLLDLSGKSPEIAQKIIEQSMANNWAGIFELKNNQKAGNTEIDKPKDNIEELLRLERG